METNFITFDKKDIAKSNGSGMISTLTNDVKIAAVPFKSDNPKAPTHRLFGFSPAGHKLEIGGIWQKTSEEGKTYYTLSVKDIALNANLGRYPGQDDPCNQAIIPWDAR